MTIDEMTAEMQSIVDLSDAEARSLTDDEVNRYESLERDIHAQRKTDEIQKRQAAYLAPSQGLQVAVKDANDEDTLERAFEAYVRTGQANSDIVELRAQGSGSTAGGYTIPPGWRQKMVDRMVDFGGLAAHAEVISTTAGESVEWPTLDDTSNSGEIVSEAGTFAAGADMVFGTATLGSYKYMSGGASNLPLKVSYELLQDSAFDVQGLITRKLAERIGRIQATHWINGTGSSQPQGLVYPKSAFGNLTTAGTFTYNELVDTVHALDPSYRTNAKWLMNDNTLARIRKVVDDNDRPLWTPQSESGMTSLPSGTLLGYPVVIDQAMPSAGDIKKLLAFGDLQESYVIRRVKDIQMVVLNELYAPNGQVGFFAWARADGVVQNTNAYVVLADKDV
jgi:HK97 family phage major capsid protein